MSADSAKRSFSLPSEIGSVPGAEGWEEMYPYYTRFRPEDDSRFWFYNSMHFPEPMPAFDVITAEVPYHGMGAYTTRVFAFPTALGIDYRILNGRIYITANTVENPEEIQRRLALFQERAGYYYENWNRIYADWEKRMRALLTEVDAITVPELPEFENAAVVTEARGIAQNHFVREAWHRCLEGYSKMWQHHFEMLMLGYGAYVVFFQFCKKAFPEIPDQTIARMVAGIDVLMFRPDDELKRLAALALEYGIDGLFHEDADATAMLQAIRNAGAAGERWLAELDQSRDPWFNVSTGDGFYHHHRSWDDDLTVPFSALPRYIAQLRDGKSLERPTAQLKMERERVTAEYRALLGTDADREAFNQMLELCHLVFPYVENHKFYCEHWYSTRFFRKVREFGALLARWNVLDNGEDIFHLHHSEAGEALTTVMSAWAAGSTVSGVDHWKPIIARRKKILAALSQWTAPPALGPIPASIEDPALQMLWGITAETLDSWSRADSGACGNEIHGYAASPGIVEGVARVLKNVNEIGQMRDGEILVCPVTAPSWAPVFGKIRAAVSDIGGTMSHAAIVAREYGMPAVVGTGQATQRIRTGQRLRVDGDSGVVTILEE
jgi:pyruvate,water dikinase